MSELLKKLNDWFIAFYEKHHICEELGDYHIHTLEKPEPGDDTFAKELLEFLEESDYEIKQKELP